MKRTGIITLSATLLVLLLVAGCKSAAAKTEWGKTYDDVPVPAGWEKYDTPPFKRTDSESGKRIYGRYAYSSGKQTASVDDTAAWFKAELPNQGWDFQTEELDAKAGKMELRFKKKSDILVLRMAPDEKVQSSNAFSVLVVEMNPQYD